MRQRLKNLVEEAKSEIARSASEKEINELRTKYLGRKEGFITQITQQIPHLKPEERAGIGTAVKEARSEIENLLTTKLQSLKVKSAQKVDITTPGKEPDIGSLHPITKVLEQVKNIFRYLSFDWVDGPEIETDEYNFQKLNIPPNHPARDVQQTYYVHIPIRQEADLVLRTHTSSMQVRYLEKNEPPIRILFPGRVFRRDMPDASHYPSFHQLEGLLVDQTTNMSELLGSLEFFIKSFFGSNTKYRIYGHHFPYTEPSIEIEVLHKKRGWLEILGAGMVHPKVLENANIDPAKFRGWAFGMGIDRLTMIKYEIDDIRLLFTNDSYFLSQFA